MLEYQLNPIFELAYKQKKFDVFSKNSKKKLIKTSNLNNSVDKPKTNDLNSNSKYGIPDKDRTCVCPLGGDCSSTELRGRKREICIFSERMIIFLSSKPLLKR